MQMLTLIEAAALVKPSLRITIPSGTSDLGTDEALEVFEQLVTKSSKLLRKINKKDKQIRVSSSMHDNYYKTVEDGGCDFASKVMVDGVEELRYRGITIREYPSWDEIANDEGKLPHRALYTTSEALLLPVDLMDFEGEIETGYQRKEGLWWLKSEFKMGIQIIFDNLMIAAY